MKRLAIVALVLSACGPSSYSDYRSSLQSAACAWAQKCGVASNGATAACPTDAILALVHDSAADRSAAGAIDVAGDHDRIAYDSDAAAACLERVRGAPCDPALAKSNWLLACSTVLTPKAYVGEACWSDTECVGGTCDHAAGCSGHCVSFAAFGAACIDDDTAPTAMRCDPTVAWCDGVTCQKKKAKDTKCTDARECSVGFLCQTGRCENVQFLDEGAVCDSDGWCKHGTFCDPTTLTCTKVASRTHACTSPLGCSDGNACIGLHAVPIGTTPTPVPQPGICSPWLHTGAVCTNDGVTGCAATDTCTSVCVQTSGTGGPGARCSDGTPCASGLSCNLSGACDYVPAIFGDCTGARSMLCASGLECAMEGQDLGVGPGHCVPDPEPACFAPSQALDAGTD